MSGGRGRKVIACACMAVGLGSLTGSAVGEASSDRLAGTAGAVPACTLVLSEHRTQRQLLALPWRSSTLQISFVHSVLGTPVHDLYQWRAPEWVLIEERFQGQGYGLAHASGPGEKLTVDANGTRLQLNRPVTPLVIRPVQAMRLDLNDGRSWNLADLSPLAIELRAMHC